MTGEQVVSAPATDLLSDELIVESVLSGERQRYEVLMRRNNARIFRVVRGMLGTDAAAEDIMQAAYVQAYEELSGFEKTTRFSTWLTGIAIHQARGLLPRARSSVSGDREQFRQAVRDETTASSRTQAQAVNDRELSRQLQIAIDELPQDLRLVYTLRALDEMSVAEAASTLGLEPDTVKSCYFRARLRLRRRLLMRFDAAEPRAFDLPLSRCDSVVAAVSRRLAIAS